jgi:nitroimidazol reductase NimA-like FMN-containing flavoprotein (pyridoxamine 5'-phosphate oxidase superfamily)
MAKPIEPIPNNVECERILTGSYSGILVMCHDGEPYAVPINHAYSDGKLYFHCAPAGRKLDMIRSNPHVCYVVNRYFGDPKHLVDGMKCHGDWESVIVYGKARVLDAPEELREAFSAFMNYYGSTDFEPSERSLKTTRAIIIEVESMTARREVPREDFDRKTGIGKVDIDYWSWSPGT